MASLKETIAQLRASIQLILCCQVPSRYRTGIRYPHPIGIVIGDGTRIGRDVRIYQNVTIGLIENTVGAKAEDYPILEDEVCVYAGAVVVGGIRIGARSIIGANAVISRDVPPDSLAFGYNEVRSHTARGKRPVNPP